MTVHIVKQLFFSISISSSHIKLKRLRFCLTLVLLENTCPYFIVSQLIVLKYSFLFIALLDTFGSTSLYRAFLSIRSLSVISIMITLYYSAYCF